jgi:hypothetical protein
LKVGSSKFGGLPDLEEGTQWPVRHTIGRPLQFLAQINLTDLPRESISATSLPKEGWLYFWFDSLQFWEELNTRLARPEPFEYPYGLVTYANGDTSLARTEYPDFPEPKVPAKKKLRYYSPPDFGPYTEHRIAFRPVMSIDKDALELLLDRVEDTARKDGESGEWERVFALLDDMHGGNTGRPRGEHRLLGSVFEPMGADMRECAQRFYSQRPGVRASSKLPAKNRKSWVMLAMLGSDDDIHRRPDDAGWLWSDAGSLCFWIRRTDLEKRDFAKAVAVIGNEG